MPSCLCFSFGEVFWVMFSYRSFSIKEPGHCFFCSHELLAYPQSGREISLISMLCNSAKLCDLFGCIECKRDK